MDRSKQSNSAGQCQEDEKKEKIQFHFIDLPPGIIRFSALPKYCSKSRYGIRLPPKRLVRVKEVDDISGLLKNLNFGTAEDNDNRRAPARPKIVTRKSRTKGIPFSIKRRAFARPKKQTRKSLTEAVKPPATKVTTGPSKIAECTQWSKNSESQKKPPSTALHSFKGNNDVFTFTEYTGFWRKAFCPTDDVQSCEKLANTVVSALNGKLQSISAMKFYQSKSYEEIRLEDYFSGRKEVVSFAHCGPKYHPVRGTDNVLQKGSQITKIETSYHVITASSEYSKESLEELRLEHYMPLISWKDRNSHSLSPKELQKQPVSLGSEVFIFMDKTSEKRKGNIQYVGRLPGKSAEEVYVGIELDGPWGNCEGYYEDRKYFRTKALHAEFVLMDSVLPAYLIDEESSPLNKLTSPKKSDEEGESGLGCMCSVCWVAPVEMFFQPCGHVCCCLSCSTQLKNCPVCRMKIQKKQRAFISGKV